MRAVAAPEAQERVTPVAWESSLPLGPGNVSMQVAVKDDEQRVTIATSLPGRLLLHWGVEGGKNYSGGWRLPGDRWRPDGSVNYKNRALQSPFQSVNGNGLQVGPGSELGAAVGPWASAPLANSRRAIWAAAWLPECSAPCSSSWRQLAELPPHLPLDLATNRVPCPCMAPCRARRR